jgi:hypothetical protein
MQRIRSNTVHSPAKMHFAMMIDCIVIPTDRPSSPGIILRRSMEKLYITTATSFTYFHQSGLYQECEQFERAARGDELRAKYRSA